MADERDSMAMDDPGAEDQADEATLQEAEDSGWTPKEQFKGNPEHWVDAKTWVEKGRTLTPLIKQQNKGLKDDLARERQERLRLEGEFRATQAALKAMQDENFESTVLDIKETRQELKRQIAQASRDGEHELVADLTEKLIDLKEPEKPKANGEARQTTQQQTDPFYETWYDRNAWYGTDHRKSGLAEGIGRELAAKGLKGQEFYTALDKELAKEFGSTRRGNGVDRQEGARGGGEGSTSTKGYHDLPADARRACDDFADKLVGERKKYKKVEDWRKAYAKQYFEGVQQ